MPFLSRFSSENKLGRLELILDIQSSIVRGSLVLFRKGTVPHILWAQSADIAHRPHGGSAYLIKTAVHAVEDISAAAHAYVHDSHGRDPLPSHINTVHCVLTSPWIVSRARTISQEFPEGTRITRAKITEIIDAERKELSSDDPAGFSSIEEKIFDVRLNGYSIPQWEGNMARSLEVSFAVSIAGTGMIERLTRAAERSGARGAPHFHSSLMLQHAGMTIVLPLHDTYTLIHAHGELTDLVAVDGRSCLLFGSHPVGVRTVIRKIAHIMKISYLTADSLLSMNENGKLSKEGNATGVKAISVASLEWVDGCKKIISLIPADRFPGQAIISSRVHQTFFVNGFTGAYPSVKARALEVGDLTSLATFDPQVEILRLTILYTAAIMGMESL